MKYITTINGVEYAVELLTDGQVSVNGKVYDVDYEEVSGHNLITLLVDGRSFEGHGHRRRVHLAGADARSAV